MHFCVVVGHNDLKQKPSSEIPYDKAITHLRFALDVV